MFLLLKAFGKIEFKKCVEMNDILRIYSKDNIQRVLMVAALSLWSDRVERRSAQNSLHLLIEEMLVCINSDSSNKSLTNN